MASILFEHLSIGEHFRFVNRDDVPHLIYMPIDFAFLVDSHIICTKIESATFTIPLGVYEGFLVQHSITCNRNRKVIKISKSHRHNRPHRRKKCINGTGELSA